MRGLFLLWLRMGVVLALIVGAMVLAQVWDQRDTTVIKQDLYART